MAARCQKCPIHVQKSENLSEQSRTKIQQHQISYSFITQDKSTRLRA